MTLFNEMNNAAKTKEKTKEPDIKSQPVFPDQGNFINSLNHLLPTNQILKKILEKIKYVKKQL